MSGFFHHDFPWKDQTPQVVSRQYSGQKPMVAKYGVIMAFFLIGMAFLTQYKITLILGLLLLLALVTKRYAAVTPRGLEFFADMIFRTNHRLIPWSDLDAITYDKIPGQAETNIFYFTRGDVTKRVTFPSADRKRILSIAQEYQPDIRIYDGKDYRQNLSQKLKKKKK